MSTKRVRQLYPSLFFSSSEICSSVIITDRCIRMFDYPKTLCLRTVALTPAITSLSLISQNYSTYTIALLSWPYWQNHLPQWMGLRRQPPWRLCISTLSSIRSTKHSKWLLTSSWDGIGFWDTFIPPPTTQPSPIVAESADV